MICVTVIFFLFSFETGMVIYVNYRNNPPQIDCSALDNAYSTEQIKFMAGLEYEYLMV